MADNCARTVVKARLARADCELLGLACACEHLRGSCAGESAGCQVLQLVRCGHSGRAGSLLARNGDITAAFALADQVDALAGTSDDPRDPGDAALNRAELNYLTGDQALAGKMIGQAIQYCKRKGATAYIARGQRLSAMWSSRSSAASTATPVQPGKAKDGHAPEITDDQVHPGGCARVGAG